MKNKFLLPILIAVVLFAGLFYVAMHSWRRSACDDCEPVIPAAAAIVEYPAVVRTTVTRMIVTGTAATSIDFEAGAGSNKVFATTQGGGAPIVNPPADIGNAQGDGGPVNGWAADYADHSWGFVDLTSVDPPRGFYILGVGMDTVNTGRDAIMYLHDINLSRCQQIQRGLRLSTTLATQSVPVVWTMNSGRGSEMAPNLVAGTGNAFTIAPSANAAKQAFSCYDNGGTNDYFHAIIEQ
jgi:hypothetical protein